jgi:hypothetical protein
MHVPFQLRRRNQKGEQILKEQNMMWIGLKWHITGYESRFF